MHYKTLCECSPGLMSSWDLTFGLWTLGHSPIIQGVFEMSLMECHCLSKLEWCNTNFTAVRISPLRNRFPVGLYFGGSESFSPMSHSLWRDDLGSRTGHWYVGSKVTDNGYLPGWRTVPELVFLLWFVDMLRCSNGGSIQESAAWKASLMWWLLVFRDICRQQEWVRLYQGPGLFWSLPACCHAASLK